MEVLLFPGYVIVGLRRRPTKPTVSSVLRALRILEMIEGNPLSADEFAIFDMFEQERWPPQDRRAYIDPGALAR